MKTKYTVEFTLEDLYNGRKYGVYQIHVPQLGTQFVTVQTIHGVSVFL